MAENTGISWADNTFNPWWGCAKVSPACRFCLDPATRVLYADMTWRPIGDVKVGDVLVGFTETPALGVNRVIEPAVVEAVWRTEQPTVELTVGDRVIVASAEHRWLTDQARPTWKTTEELTLGMPLKTLGWGVEGPDLSSEDYRAGYIAGVTTGDGTMRWDATWDLPARDHPQVYWRVAVNADDRAILDRLVDYLAGFGVEVEVRDFNGGPCAKPMLKVETRSRPKLARIAELLAERSAPDWQAGWLAGMFDTDGSYSRADKYTLLRIAQKKDNGALAAVERYAANLGYAMKRENHKGCPTARLHGRVDTQVAFLSRIAPALTRKCEGFYGRRLFGQSVEVNGIRRGPVRELVDIQTSTRTFIAEGVATHNCYANASDKRWGGDHWGRKARRKMMSDKYWRKPHQWNREALAAGRPLFIFSASMADVFEDHPDVVDARRRLWDLIEQTPALVWMLLTKRPENVAGMVPWGSAWPSNVWLGVSAETQRFADQRIPVLLSLPAAVRFVSAAPLLGPVDLDPGYCDAHGRSEVVTDAAGREWCGYCAADGFTGELSHGHWLDPLNGGIDWVITEGESGPKARPSHPDWFRSLRDQCQAAGVAFHHKQNGEWHELYPADWPLGDAWQNPHRHCWVDPVTGKTKPFGEFTGLGDEGWAHVARVGLKAAGRLLDGELHDDRPQPIGVLS